MLDPAGTLWPSCCLKGRIIRTQSMGQQEPFGFPFPLLACECSSAVGRTVPSVLCIGVENCTKRDQPRGICAAQSHCCIVEGLLELLWPVLSLTPPVDEFRLCLYSARPCSTTENVPKLFVLCSLSHSLVSAAWLLCCHRLWSLPA